VKFAVMDCWCYIESSV